jgi:hypothetical protein
MWNHSTTTMTMILYLTRKYDLALILYGVHGSGYCKEIASWAVYSNLYKRATKPWKSKASKDTFVAQIEQPFGT